MVCSVTGSTESLLTVTVKLTVPPGSGRLVGAATFWARMTGSRSPMTTSSWSRPRTVLPSSSLAVAETTLERTSPTSPDTEPLHEQAKEAPAAMSAGRPQLALSGPATSSLSTVSVMVSGDVLVMVAV